MTTDLEGAVERAAAIMKAWNRRETDLLEANNRYLERARAAEAERDAMREGLKPFSDIGDLLNSETSGFEDGDKLAVCIASAGGEEISPHVEMARLSFGSFTRAAALVNGEASDAS